MATVAPNRPFAAAPSDPHLADAPVDAAGLPIPAPDRPDALAGLSIVVVCHDDAATAASAIARAARVASRISHDYELLLIDDSSSDATAETLVTFALPGGRARPIIHADTRGSGTALSTGLAASSMPWVLLVDATDELDLDALEDFVPLAAEHDLLLGWRVMRSGPVASRLNAAAWNALVRWALGASVRDVDCPLKLVRRDLAERLELRSTGLVFGAELVARARAMHARVSEVPVRQRAEMTAPGKSGASPRLGPRTLLALARLRRGVAH
jgi:glycosyltransferase involved in cell wall biosynthesis